MAKVAKIKKIYDSYEFIHSAPCAKFNHFYEDASDCLLLSDFLECIQTCKHGIDFANSCRNIDSNKRQACINGLCTLAIQAFAELGSWSEVLTFVVNIYEKIEDIPAEVLQLVIALHCHLRDLYHIEPVIVAWLQSPRNSSRPQYVPIVETFVFDVLLPQGRSHVVPHFLHSCSPLDPDDLRRIQEKARTEVASNEATLGKELISASTHAHFPVISTHADAPVLSASTQRRTPVSHDAGTMYEFAWVHNLLRSVTRCFSQNIVTFGFKSIYRLAFVATCIYLLAVQVMPGSGVRSWHRVPGLYQTLAAAVRFMFKN